MNIMISTFKHALMITGFVGVMMLVIEYLNVMTQGRWQARLSHQRWGQYLLASLLGATPGCLGAFAVVAMYSHRRLSLGAVVAAMIATSGDESFVMFAVIPQKALFVTAFLFVIGILSGALVDKVFGRRLTHALSCESDFSLHAEARCGCFPGRQILTQWKHCSPARGTLSASLALFLGAILSGQIGPNNWNWIRISLALVSFVALFITTTVPDHFLEDHLWRHVVRGHVPRIFLWTTGALLFLHIVVEQWNLNEMIRQNQWIVLGLAALIGIIPESGPHLIFVTMFAQGVVPFSILITSSIVQDGHAMLPLLAHSRRAFLAIKLANLAVGIAVGAILMSLGF